VDSRSRILDRVRGVLDRRDGDGALDRTRDRLAARRANTVPALARLSSAERPALFAAKLEAAGATFETVSGRAGVPGAVAAYLRAHNVAADALVLAPHPLLDEMPWDLAGIGTPDHGRAEMSHGVAVSVADLGLAETGTLCFASGPTCPATLHFVPETEIVVLPAMAVVGGLEDAWAYLRARCRGQPLPRTFHFVTGPSRTADIELTLTMGAHGPCNLHVIVLDESG